MTIRLSKPFTPAARLAPALAAAFALLTIGASSALPEGAAAAQSGVVGGGPPRPSGVPMFRGVAVHHKISTKSTSAQRLFDQGLGLCFAFNHDEAIRSFQAAAEIDTAAAMPWWGIALALGPNINMPMSPEAETRALAALAKARERLAGASKPERDYIEALAVRYGTPDGDRRAARDSAYADAMRALARTYPRDVDAAVLCAEALLDLRPWDQWTRSGEPKPGTPEIVQRLEAALKKAPNHIGALHLYIHTMEASATPRRAEAAADRLSRIAPEAGHLIHMPTHIHLRVGRYADASRENLKAIDVDREYIARWGVEGIYPMMYANHNIHMRLLALCFEGRAADAVAESRRLRESAREEVVRQMQPMELFSGASYLALPRFGRWDDILAEPPPAPDLRLTNATWRFARGVALAAKGKDAEAGVERDSLAAIAAAAEGLWFGLAPGPELANFALAFLDGERAARAGRVDDAIRDLKHAVALQDSLPYEEPPHWTMTARQSLGSVLFQAGRAAEAEAVYREDLERFPDNGWSLRGLADALRAQGKAKDADAAEARFRKAWASADVPLTTSRF